jgi:type I site-specific restriction endonuclease
VGRADAASRGGSFTKGRIIVRGRIVKRGKARRADDILYCKPNIPLAVSLADRQHFGEIYEQIESLPESTN